MIEKEETKEEIKNITKIDNKLIKTYEKILMGFCKIDKEYKLCEES